MWLSSMGLKRSHKSLLRAIEYFQENGFEISHETLSNYCNYSIKTISILVKEMRTVGYIEIKKNKQRNIYKILRKADD